MHSSDVRQAQRRWRDERGIALLTAILMLALMSALLVGTTALVMSEQQSRFQVKDRTQAFQAAHSGLEKLTNDLGALFTRTYAPTDAQLAALTNNPPDFPGVQFTNPTGGPGYTITREATVRRTLEEGDFSGLTALVTPHVVTVTAQTPTESEVSVRRSVNTVAIPVFQFGIFSETDLSFFPGPHFNFGGRVHTNGNLFLAKGNGANEDNRLILAERVTAVGEVVRTNLSNGWGTGAGSSYEGEVRIITQDGGCDPNQLAGTCRPLGRTEGSTTNWSALTGTGTANEPEWFNTWHGDYDQKLKNAVTPLNLPLTSGAEPIDLIKRPATSNENVSDPTLFGQRYYQYASLRILLADNAAQINSAALPTITGTAPTELSGLVNIARNGIGGPVLVTGVLKIEKQNAAGTAWTDVTAAILALGYTGPRMNACANPSANAIIRIQRLSQVAGCGATTSQNFRPFILYDAREGRVRDSDPQNNTEARRYYRSGLMHYIELDIKNLRAWLAAQADIMRETGYVVYFSDRRGNKSPAGGLATTGELGFEDVVNTTTAAGTTLGTLDRGEDINDDGVLNNYGYNDAPANTQRLDDFILQTDAIDQQLKLFRRALKLVNAKREDMYVGAPLGLTVTSENPVYIQGDYNADMADDNAGTPNWNETYDQRHVACAVIADAVTFLSNDWNDWKSFFDPHSPATRPQPGGPNTPGRKAPNPTVYRVAIISGKSLSFPKPAFTASNDFGTDGGTHNFLRYLEDWDNDFWYRGSMVSFYTSRQAVGTFKCCTTVYGPPKRRYTFDEDFRTPALLPPRTPMLRALNVTSFSRLPGPPPPPTNP